MNVASLPKIDLHRHLEGSIRFETLVELARETRLDLSVRDLRRRSSMRGEKPGFKRFLSKFEVYRSLYPSREWIERVAFEAAEDAKKDRVVYLELRFSPTHFGRRLGAPGEDVAAWVAKGARRAGIDLSLIATFGRDFGVEGNLPTTRAVQGTDFFSGIDLAGDESVSAMPFLPLFRKLDLPVTIHAGEAGPPGNVREAVSRFGARRIGHGVRVLRDARLVEACHEVVFEVCPTSEIQTGAATSWRSHPVRRMVEKGLRVTLNTDDPAVSGITLSGEIRACLRAGLSHDDIKRAMAQAAEAAFLSDGRRRALARTIEKSW